VAAEFTFPVYNPPTGNNVSSKGFVRGIMRTLKTVALGTLFSVVGIVGYLFFCVLVGIIRGGISISTGPSHATALSAIVAGLVEGTVFNPICWLVIALAFGLAFWLVRPRQKSKSA